ncbi:hypothetical protein [Hydrogenophaga sp.]|uniref:hypothetical protein n=1 Tax=Hydrogenophaga sp. TaxID=1904254 RepID=UPI0035697C7E
MNSIVSPSPAVAANLLGRPNLAPSTASGSDRARRGFDGSRSLAALMLAAVVAALAVLADHLINTWVDGQLFLLWVSLWVVVFAALALFADTARNLASRALGALDSWSQSIAESRADQRLMDLAKTDPRVMAELACARDRAEQLVTSEPQSYSEALAPLGIETGVAPATSAWENYLSHLAASRARSANYYYI